MDDGRINCATGSTCSAGRTLALMNAAAGHWMRSGIGSGGKSIPSPAQVSGVISGVAAVLCRHLKRLTHSSHQEDTFEMTWIQTFPSCSDKVPVRIITQNFSSQVTFSYLLKSGWWCQARYSFPHPREATLHSALSLRENNETFIDFYSM